MKCFNATSGCINTYRLWGTKGLFNLVDEGVKRPVKWDL